MRKKTVAFVCLGNACRSQLSEGIAKQLAGDQWEIFSAGSLPAGFVADEAIEVLQERGVNASGQYSKSIDELPDITFDLIVTMGCGDNCPTLKAKAREDWQIPDPIGGTLEQFREVASDLEQRIRLLLVDSNQPPTS